MEHKGQFTRVGKTEKRMYGPRGLLVCGYPEEEQVGFLKLVDKVGLAGIQVVFALPMISGQALAIFWLMETKPNLKAPQTYQGL